MKILKRISILVLILILFLQNNIILTAEKKGTTAHEKIELVVIAITEGYVEMLWTSKPKLAPDVKYEIYRDDKIIDTVSFSKYKDSNLASDTKYVYKIIAKDNEENTIVESNKLTVKTLASINTKPTQENTGSTQGNQEVPATTGASAEYQVIKSSGNPDYLTDRFIVKYKNSDSIEKIQKLIKNNKLDLTRNKKISKGTKSNGIANISFNKKVKLKDVIGIIRNTPENEIEYIQPDFQIDSYSNDPYFGEQWGIKNNSNQYANNSYFSIDNIDLLPLHLQELIDLNPELLQLLMSTPINEIKSKLISGDLPTDCRSALVSEIINDPALQELISAPGTSVYSCDASVAGAWEISKGKDVLVGIIDTGVDINHEDLRNNIWVNDDEIPANGIDDDNNGYIDDVNGWNFCDQNNVVFNDVNPDSEIHGTNIAGIIGAESDNELGIAGVAPLSRIIPLKVFNEGIAYTSDIINAIQYAEDLGIKVINCSWGSSEDNPALREAMQESDMLFVCAAGNNSANIDNSPIYPAAFDLPNIITVASVDQFGKLSNFSNFGVNSIDVAAPGQSIQSIIPGNTYDTKSGTSMAAAFVSGEAALLLDTFNGLSIFELKNRIINTSEHLSSLTGTIQGGNKINCTNALNNISSDAVITVSGKSSTEQNNTVITSSKEFNLLWAPDATGQYTKVSGGYYHSLALKSDGTVWSWGDNEFGQLGDDTTDSKCSTVQVTGLTNIIEIAGGGYHNLALKSDKTVWSWGDNEFGQLGDNTQTQRTTASRVYGLDNVKAIAAGKFHSLALKNDGTVWAWGYNKFYQLGDRTNIEKEIPVQVSGLEGIISIKAGSYFSLALKDDGTVWAWGKNDYGQLGNATTNSAITADKVIGLSGIKEISAGLCHSLALREDGTILAWGYNASGQLGNGGRIDQSRPVQVAGLNGVKSISAGSSHSLALMNDDTIWAWGNNTYGQLGDETNTFRTTAVKVSGSGKYTDISSGCHHNIALKADKTVWVWGSNVKYQLGDGIKSTWPKAVKVNNLTDVKSITGGRYHSLALKNKEKTVWAWGYNEYGQLGDGTTSTRDLPTQVNGLSKIDEVAGGRFHSLALKDDGTVWAWGDNQYGQLGDGTTITQNTPVQVIGLPQTTKIIHISAGGGHSIALTEDGYVWAWGHNGSGQLGDGTKTRTSVPVQVKGLEGVKAISAGSSHNLALKKDGTVWAWGSSEYGQLGDGALTPRTMPVQVYSLKDISAISCGSSHSLALRNDGTVWAWGYNGYGQLGNEVVPYMPAASMINGLDDIISIAAGDGHCLAVKRDGTVYGWGNNAYCQLGDGTTLSRTSAVQVVGLDGIVSIAGMGRHSLAITNNKEIWAWGNNDKGQLGKGQSEYPRWVVGSPTATVPNSIRVQCELNKEFDLVIMGSNVKSFDSKIFTVLYNANQLDIIDLCKITPEKDQSLGTINKANIEIVEYNPVYGLVKFKVNKTINNGTTWSGVINVIRFKSKVTSDTTIIKY